MPKLHRTRLSNIVSVVTVRSVACMIGRKIYCVKYRHLDFLLKIYIHIYFSEKLEI